MERIRNGRVKKGVVYDTAMVDLHECSILESE